MAEQVTEDATREAVNDAENEGRELIFSINLYI